MSSSRRKKLGDGKFGSVSSIDLGGSIVAVKSYKSKKGDDDITSETIREIAFLKRIIHPNIIKLRSVEIIHGLEIVMDYGGITLKKFIHKTPLKTRIAMANSVLQQLLAGITYIHFSDIIHRDVKPTNILILDGVVKICDFNLAIPNTAKKSIGVGTGHYRAPEVFNCDNYTTSVDIWSLGCTMYEFIKDEPPFKASTDLALISCILKTVPTNVADLKLIGLDMINIESCNTSQYFRLAPLYCDDLADVDARITLDHFKKTIETMLTLNPSKRGESTFKIVEKEEEEEKEVIPSFQKLCESLSVSTQVAKLATRIFQVLRHKNEGLKHEHVIQICCINIAHKFLDAKSNTHAILEKCNCDLELYGQWELWCLRELDFQLYNFL
jgi:serine/threonine protein kinase